MHAIKIELCNQYIMQFNELSNMLQIASIYTLAIVQKFEFQIYETN